jgi:hypothetical protein
MDIAAQTAVKRAAPKADTRIASYLLTDYLERLGVEVIFGLCGHTVIGFLDAIGKSRIRFISTRHEQIAAHAADGYARASGKVGVLMTHLGPGLTNAATGVANAALDSIPMVVIAGDIPSYYYGRHPHQEVNLHQDADQFQIYRPFCKRVYRVDNVRDLPRIVERAFPPCAVRPSRARARRRADGHLSRRISRSTRSRRRRRRSRSRVSIRQRLHASSMRWPLRGARSCTPAAASCRRARPRNFSSSRKRCRCRSRTR